MKEKICREQTEEFRLYLANAKIVIKDMYGDNNSKANLMFEKILKCKTIAEINNALAWGRKNLL